VISRPSRSDPEYDTEAGDETVTAFRNLIDGSWLCSVGRAPRHLDADEAVERFERLLRLTAETRLGAQLVGSLGPEGEAVVTTTLAQADLADAERIAAILQASSARLAAILAISAGPTSQPASDPEGAWMRV
jgi:hypothetical protein